MKPAASASARPMRNIGERRSSSWTGRFNHCQNDGSARLGDPGHHARHQIGRRRDVVAQAAQLGDPLIVEPAIAGPRLRAAHDVTPVRSTSSRSMARPRTTRIFSVVMGRRRMPRISS